MFDNSFLSNRKTAARLCFNNCNLLETKGNKIDQNDIHILSLVGRLKPSG